MIEIVLVSLALLCLLIGGWLGFASMRHYGPATGHIALAQAVGGVALALPAYFGIGIWLQVSLEWPERYGFTCRGRGCWLSDLYHSPALLGDPGAKQFALFAYFWALPALVAGAVIYAFITKRGVFSKSDSE